MKIRKITWLLALFLMLINVELSAQTVKPEPANFDRFISEVYTNQGASQITPDTRRYAFMQTFINERITYVQYDPKKLEVLNYVKLSQIPLYDTYNKSLQRDMSFNPASFNPFKYQFEFYGPQKQYIHVDNSNYVIVITPQA